MSAASHFPATRGREAGERTFLHGERSSAQTPALESRSCRTPTRERQRKVLPAPSHWNCWLLVRFSHPVELRVAAAMHPVQQDALCRPCSLSTLSALANVAGFSQDMEGCFPATSLPPAAPGATQPWLCSEPVPALSGSPLPPLTPRLTHRPRLREARGPVRWCWLVIF